MTKHINITSVHFEKIGFGEAHLLIGNPFLCKKYFPVYLWGLNLKVANLLSFDFINNPKETKNYISDLVKYPPETNIYISGWVRMLFTNPIEIDIDVALYSQEKEENVEFIKDGKGNYVSQKWTKPIQNYNKKRDVYSYILQGVSHFPYGYSQVNIKASPVVRLFFEKDCKFITTTEYSSNPQKYSYNEGNSSIKVD